MSSPALDLGSLINSLVTALTDAFNTLINAISQNISGIVSLAIGGAFIGLTFALLRRYGRQLVGWVRGLVPF